MIQVGDKYQIREEVIDYSVWEKNEKNKIAYKCVGYYKNLKSSVRAILEREAHNSTINELTTLKEAITRLERVAEIYEGIAKQIAGD